MHQAMSTPVMEAHSSTVVISIMLAAYFLLAALPWLFTAIHPRRHALGAASHAAMGLGTGLLVLLML